MPGSTAGTGSASVGMARQGYDIALTRYNERGWRATFYASGVEHSLTDSVNRSVAPATAPSQTLVKHLK